MLEHRPYQARIIEKTIKSYRDGNKSVMIESPPGSGKTVMGLSIMKKIWEDPSGILDAKPKDVTFGWVCMRRNLLLQAQKENEDKIQCPNIEYISMFDKKPPKVDVLVVDEGHHDSAASCSHIHNVSDPNIVLGLTATPYRTDRMRLCFSKIIKDAGFHRLIQDGYLSKFDQWMLPEYTVEEVTNAYLQQPETWGQTVIFFLSIRECMEAADILSAAGIKCDVVTGQTDRYTQIDKFMNGETNVLLNVYVLTEGFDYTGLQTVFVRDSQKGPTIQMSGRSLRKHPDIPIKNIVQSKYTRYPFTRTAAPVHQNVLHDGEWRTVGVSDLAIKMHRKMLCRMMTTDCEIPKFIKRRKKTRL